MKQTSDSFLYNAPFYSLIPGLYSALFLWQANFSQAPWFVIKFPLIFSLAVTAIVCLVSWLSVRKLRQAAAIAGLVLVLFFSYGHFYNLVEDKGLFGLILGRHRFILPLWGAILFAGVFWIVRSKSDFRSLTWISNVVYGLLLLVTCVQLGRLAWTASNFIPRQQNNTQGEQHTATGLLPVAHSPDVYYFLLDGYDREDMLLKESGLDNHKFIAQLEALGFVVPECTQSNYDSTLYSMSSTFNMSYLDELGYSNEQLTDIDESDVVTLGSRIENSPVIRFFQDNGYKLITLKTVFPFIDIHSSDIIYDFQSASQSSLHIESFNFGNLFLRTTLMRVAVEAAPNNPDAFTFVPDSILQYINPKISDDTDYAYFAARQNLYQLAQLDKITQIPGKKFLYAHLMVTHPPFSFTPAGELISPDVANDSPEAYADQVIYLNYRLLKIIKTILAGSEEPPIIVLQADHAFGHARKLGGDSVKILNAYYLPGGVGEQIYPSITPINTFRLVLTNYFGLDYPLIPDRSTWFNNSLPNGFEAAPPSCVK